MALCTTPALRLNPHPDVVMKLVIGLLISALCLYLAMRGVDFQQAWAALATARWVWLIPAALITLLIIWIKSMRWRRLMLPLWEYSYHQTFDAYAIGQLANYILPMRAGELVRVLVIARGEIGLSRSAALASVVSERVIDVACLLFLALLTIALFPTPAWITYSCWIMAGVVLGFTLALLMLRRWQHAAVRLAQKTERILPRSMQGRLGGMVTSFSQGFVGLAAPGQYALFVLETVLIWSLQATVIYCMFLAFGLHASHGLGVLAAMVTVVVISLGAAIPSSPGMVGTFHLGAVVGLGLCGVDKDIAISYAVILHLLGIVINCAVGVWSLHSSGLGAGFLSRARREGQTPPA